MVKVILQCRQNANYPSVMTNCQRIVEQVCRFPLDIRQAGISPNQWLRKINLPAHRGCISSDAILSCLRAEPELVEHWLLWSEDKRCSPAWYFHEAGDHYVVGYYDGEKSENEHITDRFLACAQFVVHDMEDLLKLQTCPKCGGFIAKITITEPYVYYDLVKQLQTMLTEGTMSLVRATCDLKAIGQNLPWPADYIEHLFECTSCGRQFRLAIETYHGSGGVWEVV